MKMALKFTPREVKELFSDMYYNDPDQSSVYNTCMQSVATKNLGDNWLDLAKLVILLQKELDKRDSTLLQIVEKLKEKGIEL